MLGRAGVIVWAALTVGCATRRVEDIAWEVEPTPDRPIAVALAADPPLPGESLAGWEGLEAVTVLDATDGLSLATALELARERNAGLLGARHDAAAARWSAIQAGRLPNPSVEVEAFPADHGVEVEGGVEFGLTDALLAPARGRVARSASEAEAHAADEAAVRLTYDVTAAYWAAVAAEARLGIAQRALDALAAARDVADARVASGNAAAIELAAHTAAYERTRGEVAALELTRQSAREHVNTLLGLTGAEAAWTLGTPLPGVPETLALDATEEQALTRSHALAAGRARLDALARQGSVARAERGVPDVSVAVLGAWEGQAAGRDAGEWRAGVGLHTTLPVFATGSAEGRAWDARFDAEAARVQGLVAETGAAVRVARARLTTAHARAVHERDVVLPAHRRLTRETLLHYNAMQLGVYELLQARAAELAAELAHIETLRELWTAKAAGDALLAGASVDAGTDTGTIEIGGASAGGGH